MPAIESEKLSNKMILNFKIRKVLISAFLALVVLIKIFSSLNLSVWVIAITAYLVLSTFIYDYLLKNKAFAKFKPERFYFIYITIDIIAITVVFNLIGSITWAGFIFYSYYIIWVFTIHDKPHTYYVFSLAIILIFISALLFHINIFPPTYVFNEFYQINLHQNIKYIGITVTIIVFSLFCTAYYASIPTNLLKKKNKELEETQKKLQAANDKLKTIDKAKTEFISIASHQLRTPLSAIKWTLNLMKEEASDRLNEEQKDLLKKAYTSNERMIKLVSNLLNVSRIEQGKLTYKYELVELKSLFEGVIQDLKPNCIQKNITIQFNDKPLSQTYPAKIDRIKFSQAVQNLIDNAIKYNKKHGIIIISFKKKKFTYEITIKDTGIGIPKDQFPKIFTKFSRAENAVRKQIEGTGLGLFIVKSIIEKHDGSIRFNSIINKGTVFVITLPMP